MLLTSCNCRDESHLIISDAHNLTKSIISKIRSVLESGARLTLINEFWNPEDFTNSIIFETKSENEYCNRLEVLRKPFELEDLERYGRLEVDCIVDRVFVDIKDGAMKRRISSRCRRLRIPVNVTNSVELSTFSMLSIYRKGDLQIGVTTNNQGCKLANRIKRELVQSLPENIDEIVSNVGELRRRIRRGEGEGDGDDDDDDDDGDEVITTDDKNTAATRSRWLSQIIEYFPLSKLADISVKDLSNSYREQSRKTDSSYTGELSLVGSGPGSLSMLTLGALNAIYSADIVLSDKLVPQEIIDIIPKHTELFIAKKFPGNSKNAQEQLLDLGLENLAAGKNVVRLKQGDPYIFGRGGEEYKFFSDHGYSPKVIPGLSSALVAPVMANIPTTQRDVSDQVLICTGTGKNGKVPKNLPDFDEKRTVVFLMSIKKIVDIMPVLLQERGYPAELPVCVVERASCPDQRVIRTRLSDLAEVIHNVESRPPGLIVAGYSCEYLVPALREGEKYRVEEGRHETGQICIEGILEGLRK
ncbi:DEKNAAC104343 [Brettanomyces naardenensis]|uniref:DEKNAAC104343 n=1 Tax=Brettanomyces naardenensis TaxID=13370 RepID=A0A448YQP2_BRENA|nr:DEKNAAC104343 [Brettanomyces naardenensis]